MVDVMLSFVCAGQKHGRLIVISPAEDMWVSGDLKRRCPFTGYPYISLESRTVYYLLKNEKTKTKNTRLLHMVYLQTAPKKTCLLSLSLSFSKCPRARPTGKPHRSSRVALCSVSLTLFTTFLGLLLFPLGGGGCLLLQGALPAARRCWPHSSFLSTRLLGPP